MINNKDTQSKLKVIEVPYHIVDSKENKKTLSRITLKNYKQNNINHFFKKQNIFNTSKNSIDIFLQNHTESRELTRNEIVNIKALCDTAIKFNFGEEVLLGPGRSMRLNCMFKVNEDTWIVWKTNEKRTFFEPETFNSSKNACIRIIERTYKSEDINLAIDYFNSLIKELIPESSLTKFAIEMGYIYTPIKIKKMTKQ